MSWEEHCTWRHVLMVRHGLRVAVAEHRQGTARRRLVEFTFLDRVIVTIWKFDIANDAHLAALSHMGRGTALTTVSMR